MDDHTMESGEESPTKLQSRSAGGISMKSGSAKSKASINVTLPHPASDVIDRQSPVHIRGYSPDRHKSFEKKDTSVQPSFSPQSHGTVPPQGTPTRPMLSQNEIRRLVAARMIENVWLSYRDRQMFKLLKHAVCAAEHSLSYEILRKVSPKEAELLKDKSMQAKVRFRFGGCEYPPMIYFKIFSSNKSNGGMGINYVSGKKMIQAASEAAQDACDLMGNRQFYAQLLQDSILYETHKIADEVDVMTLKDYMQYLSLLDETPAYMGGRDNGWRKLTLQVLPRATIFYDVVSYLYSNERAMSDRLKDEIAPLLVKPLTQDIQLQHINLISKLRIQEPPAAPVVTMPKQQVSSRRSRQARLRVLKMRRLYEKQEEVTETTEAQPAEHMFFDGDWEEEADRLYEWTQELSVDDMPLNNHSNTLVT